jgi:hypothetical protein
MCVGITIMIGVTGGVIGVCLKVSVMMNNADISKDACFRATIKVTRRLVRRSVNKLMATKETQEIIPTLSCKITTRTICSSSRMHENH